MTINEVIDLLQNQITTLLNARALAVRLGDINQVFEIDNKLSETEATLSSLRSILS
jgi:hypothetical protein